MPDKKPINKDEKTGKHTPATKPEPETLHTTDPQEHMEGPVSSLMHGTGHTFETKKSKEEADREKEKDM